MIVYFFISLLIPLFISCEVVIVKPVLSYHAVLEKRHSTEPTVELEVLKTQLYLDINHSTEPTFREPTFSYKQEVPYYDRHETLFSTTSRSFLASYGRCAVQCIEDLSCNAIELCRVPGGSECRGTTGLLKTTTSVSIGSPCKQFLLVRTNLLKVNFMYFK